MKPAFEVAALSDVGCVRPHNEDSYGYDPKLGIFVVSDGMGGSAGGEVASRMVVEHMLASYRSLRHSGNGTRTEALFHSVRAASAAVYTRGEQDETLRGMGATLVALVFGEGKAVIANVGDSRAYLLRHGAASQITVDHSLVAEQVKLGLISEAEAAVSAWRSTITRAMGTAPEVEPDLFGAELAAGDRILLATDGLTRHVSDAEIAHFALPPAGLEDACRALIELTRERGARDNVTCLLFAPSVP